jgi:sulfoxide reductase heme-binding subunit YedZ
MSHAYRAVGWNRQKRIYDTLVVSGVAAYLAIFVLLNVTVHPNATIETILIRGFGTAALVLLHVILSIGPLCRLDRRFLPLLYNRRHMGVTMFVLALAHGGFALVQFHSQGDLNPFVSLLASETEYTNLRNFPFQPLGAAALVILFLMAATSHDFWLANLTAPVWKSLHMAVYFAYALILLHVAFGVLQAETSPILAGSLALGLVWICSVHLIAAFKERRIDTEVRAPASDGFVFACKVSDIPEKRAKIICLSGERVAIFKYDGKVSAISNVCQHQNGPLGEGCIRNGLVTCPWHGYEYLPDSGASPPPFKEKVPTFRVQILEGNVWMHPQPNPPGTRVEPALIPNNEREPAHVGS